MIALLDLIAVKCSRWAGAPRLKAAYLMRSNRTARQRLLPLMLGLGALLALVGLYLGRDWVPDIIKWLRHQILATTGLAFVTTAIATARRRVRQRADYARSWLAALPVKPEIAGWEALFIEMLPAAAAVAALTGVFAAVTILAALVPANRGAPALAVWTSMSAGVILGAILSYAIPGPKPVDLPPGSRYVPHGRSARAAPLRPSLKALGVWPLRLMFARAQPTLVARAILPILVMMPIGTSAAAALGIIAFYVVAGALLLLIPAVISVSGLGKIWMAPLPVRGSSMALAVLIPSIVAIVGASAAQGLFLFVIGVSLRAAAAAGLCIAGVGCLVTIAVANWRARVRSSARSGE